MSNKNNKTIFFYNDAGEAVPCGQFIFQGFGMYPDDHQRRFGEYPELNKRRLFVLINKKAFLVWPNDYLRLRDIASHKPSNA